MQKVVLFDIDYVLFNTQLYREKLFTSFAKKLSYPNTKEFIIRAEQAIVEARKFIPSFEPKKYHNYLQDALEIEIPQDYLGIVAYSEEMLSDARYKEVSQVFEKLTQGNVEIGIFSTGSNEFQKSKIRPFSKFITDKHLYIHPNKQEVLNEVLRNYQGDTLYLVDDLLDLLRKAKKYDPKVMAIWVKRGRVAESTVPFADFTPDLEVVNLQGITHFILKD